MTVTSTSGDVRGARNPDGERKAWDLAPGQVLLAEHLRRRLRVLRSDLGRAARFVEVGAGTGWLSETALDEGCQGWGFDLNSAACAANAQRNRLAIAARRYRVVNDSFSVERAHAAAPVDLVFSCMVLEHLSEAEIAEIATSTRASCKAGGMMAAFVPAGMRYWGIEDEIAGHLRRYEIEDLPALTTLGLPLRYWSGLTFPLSNVLRPVSDRLVARFETDRLKGSRFERTVASGLREVRWKTRFPRWVRHVSNPWTLWPFDVLQRLFARCRRSMVLYAEWTVESAPVDATARRD